MVYGVVKNIDAGVQHNTLEPTGSRRLTAIKLAILMEFFEISWDVGTFESGLVGTCPFFHMQKRVDSPVKNEKGRSADMVLSSSVFARAIKRSSWADRELFSYFVNFLTFWQFGIYVIFGNGLWYRIVCLDTEIYERNVLSLDTRYQDHSEPFRRHPKTQTQGLVSLITLKTCTQSRFPLMTS